MKSFRLSVQILVSFLCISMLTGCIGIKQDSMVKPSVSEKTIHTTDKQNKKIVYKPKDALSLSNETLSSFSNQLCGWGFVKKQNALPQVDSCQAALLSQYDGYYYDAKHADQKVMYLTFDEGYENGNTAKILDVLKEKKVSAAFFITGPYLDTQQDLVKRMVEEGHVVGNHTIHHPSMPSIADNQALANEMICLNNQFYDLTKQNMIFMRPPRGEFSERTLALTQNLGYKTVLWSFAYRDWETDKQMGEENAFQAIVPYFHNGAILLLHAVSSDNAAALGRVIDEAQKQGYHFASLDELLK